MGGQVRPLDSAVRDKMEQSFDAEFSEIKVHADSGEAAQMGVRSFSRGNTLYFAPGQYAPGTTAGQQLIGHELAHVVQRRQGRVATDDPVLEAEAELCGRLAACGQRAPVKGL